MFTHKTKGEGAASPTALRAVFNGLAHQLMCVGIMTAGHIASNHSQTAANVMSHAATNIALMGLALWCGYRGDRGWRQNRGPLASAFEKAGARGLIAAAALGMAAMHIPGVGMHASHGQPGCPHHQPKP